jgi:hypothetical protein
LGANQAQENQQEEGEGKTHQMRQVPLVKGVRTANGLLIPHLEDQVHQDHTSSSGISSGDTWSGSARPVYSRILVILTAKE